MVIWTLPKCRFGNPSFRSSDVLSLGGSSPKSLGQFNESAFMSSLTKDSLLIKVRYTDDTIFETNLHQIGTKKIPRRLKVIVPSQLSDPVDKLGSSQCRVVSLRPICLENGLQISNCFERIQVPSLVPFWMMNLGE